MVAFACPQAEQTICGHKLASQFGGEQGFFDLIQVDQIVLILFRGSNEFSQKVSSLIILDLIAQRNDGFIVIAKFLDSFCDFVDIKGLIEIDFLIWFEGQVLVLIEVPEVHDSPVDAEGLVDEGSQGMVKASDQDHVFGGGKQSVGEEVGHSVLDPSEMFHHIYKLFFLFRHPQLNFEIKQRMSSGGRRRDIFSQAGATETQQQNFTSNPQNNFGSVAVLHEYGSGFNANTYGTAPNQNQHQMTNQYGQQQQQGNTYNQQQNQQANQYQYQQQQQVQQNNQYNQQSYNQYSQEQNQNNQQYQQQNQFNQYSNQQQYGNNQYQQNYQNYQAYEPQKQDYTNLDYVPDKIDLKYYGIVEEQFNIKFLSILKLSTFTQLYQYAQKPTNEEQMYNQLDLDLAKKEQIQIAKSLKEQDVIHFNEVYRISTEKGQWFCKINEVDRITMILCSFTYSINSAYALFDEVEEVLQDKQILQIQSGLEVAREVEKRFGDICQKYEKNANVQQTKHQIKSVNKNFTKDHKTQINKIELLEKQSAPETSALSTLKDLCSDLKNGSCQNLGPCVCILVMALVGFCLYYFILRNIFSSSSPTDSGGEVHGVHGARHLKSPH